MKKNAPLIIILLLVTVVLSTVVLYCSYIQRDPLLHIKLRAKQGDAKAQYSLGIAYAKGQGVKQDYVEAAKWLKQAGLQGNANAEFSLGLMYYEGTGVKIDYHQAAQWFDEACDNGSPEACKMYQQLKSAGY
ncbi:MAG: tetratricopeptide repeat protein [Chlorobiaceae bacterium]